MEFLADTHIHLYPEHQPERLLDAAWSHLRPWAQTAAADIGVFMVEVNGCHYFEAWRDASVGLPRHYRIEPGSDPCALLLVEDRPDTKSERKLWCFAGRQIITAERLEILGLVMNGTVEDGLPAAEAIHRVHQLGGIPVLAWGLGKWLLGRSNRVRDLLGQFDADTLWIGDNAIRPRGWLASRPLRDPQRRILAGSDPLPLAGEEAMAGTYGTRFPGGIDPTAPSDSARSLLRSPPAQIKRIGHRNPPFAVAHRMWRYHHRQPGSASLP